MNVHDSERLAGLLETAGYVDIASLPADERPEVADVVVFNTCAVRENADNKLCSNLGHLRPAKLRNPGLQIAVGGCLAQKDRETIVSARPQVDVVFGTTTSAPSRRFSTERGTTSAPRSRSSSHSSVSPARSRRGETRPTPRGCRSRWAATTRAPSSSPACARETDRRPGDILAEIEALVARASWSHPARPERQHLWRRVRRPCRLRQVAAPAATSRARASVSPAPPGRLHRRRHRAMADTPNVMPSLHMPLQSARRRAQGHATLLSRRALPRHPRPRPSRDPRRGDHDRPHRRLPGREQADFAETLRVVEAARFSSAFTFQYSIRPGTPAATMPDQVPGGRPGSASTGSSRSGGHLVGRQPAPGRP